MADENTSVYQLIDFKGGNLYVADHDDQACRHQIIAQHRARRASLQATMLQTLDPEQAAALQLVFLQLEVDAQLERQELHTSWGITIAKAQEVGIEQGRSNGYVEAIEVLAPTSDAAVTRH